jgi:hypothetical protein
LYVLQCSNDSPTADRSINRMPGSSINVTCMRFINRRAQLHSFHPQHDKQLHPLHFE